MSDYSLGPYVYSGHYALLHQVLVRTGWRSRSIALEFGVGGGDSTRLIAEHMPVIGFDSFDGLPEDWREGFPAGMFAQDRIPDVPNATFVVGLFEDTLPKFAPPCRARVDLVHIDCDLYSSTKTVLEHIRPYLHFGCLVVFDEWHGYEGCEQYEQRAWREMSEGLTWEVVGHSNQQWAVRIV